MKCLGPTRAASRIPWVALTWFPPMVLRSEGNAPVTWEPSDIENDLGVKLPLETELVRSRVSELRLNEDATYGHWGRILWSPVEVVARHNTRSA